MTIPNQNRRSAGFWAELLKSFRLAWRLLRDRRVPFVAKLIPLVVVVYVLSPFDLVPDVLLGLGQLDDLTLLILGTQVFIAVCPSAVVQSHRDEIDGVSRRGWTTTGEHSNTSSASQEIIDGK